jgi:hypothetical protein
MLSPLPTPTCPSILEILSRLHGRYTANHDDAGGTVAMAPLAFTEPAGPLLSPPR